MSEDEPVVPGVGALLEMHFEESSGRSYVKLGNTVLPVTEVAFWPDAGGRMLCSITVWGARVQPFDVQARVTSAPPATE